MTCYTDVGGSPGEVTTSPATLVSSPEKWLEFEKRWNETLKNFGFAELHMKKFAHFKGQYEPLRFDEPKRRRFLNELMWIIEECVEYAAAISVYSDDYAYHDRHYQLSEFMRPYTMGCLGCAGRVVIWGREQGYDRNEFIWLFEKGDQDQDDLKKHWEIAYPDAAIEPKFLRKHDKYLSAETRRIRPFEAADLIGYENLLAHRKLSGPDLPLISIEELRKPMQRLLRMAGGDKWGYISEREILGYCDKYKIPTR